MTEVRRIEMTVHAATLLKIAAVGALLALLWFLRDIISLLVIAAILAILISPVGDFCERHRLPRTLGILVVYLLTFGVLGFVFALLAQPFIAEIELLAGSFPSTWERIISAVDSLRAFTVEYGFADQLRQFASNVQGSVAHGVFGAISGAFGGALSFLLVLVLTFYLATSATIVRRTLIGMAPARWQPFLIGVIPRVERKMGGWLRGILALAVIMGVLVYLGLSIIGVEYALLLAVLAAFAEVVPYVGPILATLIAVLLTLIQAPVKALVVLVFFIILQQIENHLLVPKIMERAVGVHPVVSMIALLVGAKLGGLPGALLSIPIVAGLIVFSEEYARERRSQRTP